MSAGVAIVGTGVGSDRHSCLDSLKRGTDGIGPMRWLSSVHSDRLPVAEVQMDNQALAGIVGLSPDMPRTALLSAAAASEALSSMGLKEIPRSRKGFISATTVGGMDLTEQFFKSYAEGPDRGRLKQVVYHDCGAVSELVAQKIGMTDYVTTISTACSSSANAIFHAARLIRQGHLDLAVAGGADALSRFTLNGFNTLMILDEEPCRPFDENRHGLNLGEGAGYLVLASDAFISQHKLKTLARLTGYCNANDAFHQTASSPTGEGSFLAMQGALQMCGLQPKDISYINLHGTGTQNNDQSEGTAIQRIFGDRPPPMSSTKSFTGHTLGASGGVEAVFSVMAIANGIVYPNLRFKDRMEGFSCAPQTTLQESMDIRHVLSNSFGFGGNCSSLVFSRS
jgi:3-oxoacyl-[acyl-carrier-protein] synthase I